MEIEAIYNNGRLELPEHIRLKHQRVKVRLSIPDQEVETESSVAATAPEAASEAADYAAALEARLQRIRKAPLPDDADLPPVTDKQQQRAEAFAVRDELKKDS